MNRLSSTRAFRKRISPASLRPGAPVGTTVPDCAVLELILKVRVTLGAGFRSLSGRVW